MLKDAFESIIEQDFAIAYLKLLGQLFYKHITVTMLVETAGYGRATFYAYFSGLKDLRHKLSEYDLEVTERIYTEAMHISDAEKRKAYLQEELIPHVKQFWPLLHENNMPSHIEEMKKRLYDLFRASFVEKFKDTKFDSVIVESFCIAGTLHMMTRHLSCGDDITEPQTIKNMIEFMDHMLFGKAI